MATSEKSAGGHFHFYEENAMAKTKPAKGKLFEIGIRIEGMAFVNIRAKNLAEALLAVIKLPYGLEVGSGAEVQRKKTELSIRPDCAFEPVDFVDSAGLRATKKMTILHRVPKTAVATMKG
jgi:hypothetical protein